NSIKQWLREFNLSVHSVHSPFRNFKTLSDAKDSAEYRQNIWHKTIDDCSDFGVSIMVVHGLDRKEYNYTKDQAGIIRDSLADLCEYGKKRGVMIALENLPGSGKNDDEIVCTLAEHLKNYPGLGLKFCLDIGHAVLNGSDIIDEIHAAGKDLLTFHIHNNDGAADSHNLPLDGIIDWPGLYSYLRNTIGFKDQFVLEVCGGEDPFEVMNSIDALFS
ncbi:sugar phosphate isomerase/epimerase, partial [Treponema sp. OttesenSCG-928-L16]|nr:sugar phosphate isomerase/epimerase [Treponema sp. OttesenSCG-928-L16]